jgi:hypothetical protein
VALLAFRQALIASASLFRIHVASDQPSPGPDNRFFWLGLREVDAYPEGDSSVEQAWPGFDFTFQTYGSMPTPTKTVSWGQIKATCQGLTED